jgi:hypothetical protein
MMFVSLFLAFLTGCATVAVCWLIAEKAAEDAENR